MDDITLKEIYYYSIEVISQTFSNINYVKINNTLNGISSFFINAQTKLIKQDGTYGGLYYINKNVQENNLNNISNSTNIITITNNNGTLMYMLPFNSENLVPGDSYYAKPIYTSGIYLNKDIIIHQQVLNDINNTRKITIFY